MSEFQPEINYHLRNGLPFDPVDCEFDEERIEEGSDVFFAVLSPLINVQTGRFDPERVPDYIAGYQEAVGQLEDFSPQEIDYSHLIGLQCIEDHVQLIRDSEARRQYGA